MFVPDPAAVFAPLAARPGSVWLDGGPTSWSILAWDPVDVRVGGDAPVAGRAMTRVAAADGDAPFVGGVIGWLGYDGGGPEPASWLARFDGALCFHAPTQRWVATGAAAVRAEAAERLAAATPLAPPGPPDADVVELSPALDAAAFRSRVTRILRWIHEGDCYQVNLTRAVHARGIADPWPSWLRLRSAAGAAYGAFFRPSARTAVLSSSPELLLAVDGKTAWSEPIKGTRPRDADPVRDAAQHAALEASEKDRAELVMIVDLVRNDLGRVALPGAVRWDPRQIDAHPNVFHASQRVSATLRPDVDVWDALAALSPAGSVTGCPKVRAMQRIAELEPEPRGVYCGSLGYVSDHGRARWNVAIRTAVWHDGAARWHVGGGIVADSDPASEWQETVDKERLLRASFLGP